MIKGGGVLTGLVQIASYLYPYEAHLAKGLLESQGIKCLVFDEEIVHANPFISTAVGGVKLLVHHSEAERALAILREVATEEDQNT